VNIPSGQPPTAPNQSFASDNASGVSPEVLEALVAAAPGSALAYGDDPWTRRASDAMRELLGTNTTTLLCWGGTGANVVGLASVLQPHECVVTVDTAHIVVDECGAPVRFSGSALQTVPHVDGKLDPAALDTYLQWLGSEHHAQPKVVSISQATEMGTVYSSDEIASICDHAHRSGLVVHLDGARLANAVAASGSSLVEMVVDAGVDVMTFGMTKNGAMYGEAVVFLRPELAPAAAFVRKQAGQLPSKSRFIAAQLLALLDNDLWLRNAAQANDMAEQLAERAMRIEGVELVRPPEVNSVFVRLPLDTAEALQRWSFFWDWDLSDSLFRWMTSFATTPADVEAFAVGVEQLMDTTRP
jgi:threonine aldolase